MASADVDVYRPFTGRRGAPRRAWLTIGMAGVRGGLRGKLALLLLFGPVAIGTVVFSFFVYAKFALQAGVTPGAQGLGSEGALIGMIGARASEMIEVRKMIVMFHLFTRMFGLLAVGWYGAGLVAEDRRLGAHLLYFSRPIGRLDYLGGKLLTVSVFAAFTALVPVLVIFVVAAFASDDWAFVRLEGDVILRSILYSFVWIAVTSSLVIGVSALCERKSFALVTFFGLFMINEAVSGVLVGLQKDPRWSALGLLSNLTRIGQELVGGQGSGLGWPIWWSWAMVGGVTALSLAVASRRVRRMEVVA